LPELTPEQPLAQPRRCKFYAIARSYCTAESASLINKNLVHIDRLMVDISQDV